MLHKVVELGVACIHAAKLDDAGAHVCRELVAQGPARYADDGELLGQQVGLAQVKQRGQQLALGQIAGGAKDHQDPRIGNPLRTLGDLRKILRPHICLNGCHCSPVSCVKSFQLSAFSFQFLAPSFELAAASLVPLTLRADS